MRKFNTTKQGRLDYFLVSEELLTCIKGASIGSDHRTDAMSKGKPFWKFNNYLLKDKCYIDEVKKVIPDVKIKNKKTICMHYRPRQRK